MKAPNAMQIERFALSPAPLAADANIRIHYPINHGTWVVHPDIDPRAVSFCRYTLDFRLPEPTVLTLHVSADNRFELSCDGTFIGMGPDRSDVEHWSFHSYRVTLDAGGHKLTADVHYLHEQSPYAQTSREPAFLLVADDAPVALDTGKAPWKATMLQGVSTPKAALQTFFVVGPDYAIDGAAFFAPPRPVAAAPLRRAGRRFGGGTMLSGWKLHPTCLPEQLRRPVGGGGRIRSVSAIADEEPFPDDAPAADSPWQALVEGAGTVTVPPATRVTVLWDLDQYHTAYPEVTLSGGRGSSVAVRWAESCCIIPEGEERPNGRHKGNRDAIVGKFFLGNGDTFLPDGPTRTFRPFWWRAGRYVRIVVETAAEPLTIERIALIESRMPLENDSTFTCSDADFPRIVDVCARGIQMCAHETYMDCPYYEQLMYVGDTRVQMLTAYVMSAEDRLNQRGIELFDWSRRETGFVMERYPSDPKQLSATFAMIWVLMLHDHAWWRNAPEFIRARLKGMRCLLEEFKALQGEAELLPALPGWSFMDWVDTLSFVNSPGPDASVSAVVNLLFINTLNAAADLEDAFGEPHLAAYNQAWAERLARAVDDRFWNRDRGLFADDPEHTRFSEHSQCLALLSGRFPDRHQRCLESLLTAEELLRATVYFSFYLHEVLTRFGRPDLLLEKFGFWKEMVANGFKTPVEMPEPSRSDCHAWGSHPLFHMHAGLAGIRPAAPGFAEVRISPQPGPLTALKSTIPHPAGEVTLTMERNGDTWHATVSLPPGVPGTLIWQGTRHALEGNTSLQLAVSPALH